MPVVILAPVAIVLVAILAALFIWAFVYLVMTIANLIPDWSFPGFTSLRGYVVNAADAAYSIVSRALHAALSPLVAVIVWPVNLLELFVMKIFGAITAVRDVASWTIHTLVPILRLQIAQDIAVAQSVAQTYAQILQAQAIADIVSVQTQLAGIATTLYQASIDFANAGINDAKALATADYFLALKYADQVGINIAAVAQGMANAALAQAETDINKVAALTSDILSTAERDIAAAADASERFAKLAATTAAAAAVGVLVTDVDKVVTAVWPDIRTDVDALLGVIATDLPDIGAAIKAIPIEAPLTIAGSLAATFAVTQVLTRYLKECGIPNCRNLSAVGRDLQSLFSMVEGGALIALLAEAATDPIGAARNVTSLAGGIVDGAASTFRQVVGV